MNNKDLWKEEILDEVYDYMPVKKEFNATELIGNIDCISDLKASTQHNKILRALRFGIKHHTIVKRGRKFKVRSSTEEG